MPLSRTETLKAGGTAGTPAARRDWPRNAQGLPLAPRNLAELNDHLDRCSSEGGARIAAVARYAIDQPFEVAFGTVHSVAERSAVSSTSVIRLALTLGFGGFRDMREFFRSALRTAAAPPRRSDLD